MGTIHLSPERAEIIQQYLKTQEDNEITKEIAAILSCYLDPDIKVDLQTIYNNKIYQEFCNKDSKIHDILTADYKERENRYKRRLYEDKIILDGMLDSLSQEDGKLFIKHGESNEITHAFYDTSSFKEYLTSIIDIRKGSYGSIDDIVDGYIKKELELQEMELYDHLNYTTNISLQKDVMMEEVGMSDTYVPQNIYQTELHVYIEDSILQNKHCTVILPLTLTTKDTLDFIYRLHPNGESIINHIDIVQETVDNEYLDEEEY